jgi:methylmalonyl-CoA mutase N-terminal domain/subunit
MGLDSDDPRSEGEVGRIGVAIDSLEDMERMYEGIDIAEISSAYTINATANILLAMYVAMANKRNVPLERLRGTVQNEIIKEHLSRGLYIYPLEPAIKMTGDTIEYCLKNMPQFNPINISIHHIYAGATQVQAWAVMFLSAICYVEEVLKRGYSYDEIAPVISFLHNTDMDFLSNIGLIRAVRRTWAKIGKERFQAEDPRSMMMRIGLGVFVQKLTDKQPLNNLCRITVMALAAALAGVNSMHLGSYDEAYAIPTEEATRLSLMIQNILIEETNICSAVDPFGGAYFIERLTNDLESEIIRGMRDIDASGGIVRSVEDGSLQEQWSRQAYQEELDIQNGKKIVVGVNKYTIEESRTDYEDEMFEVPLDVETGQIERLRRLKSTRSNGGVQRALNELGRAAADNENLIPFLISAAESYATVGEMCSTLKKVYGEYHERGTA